MLEGQQCATVQPGYLSHAENSTINPLLFVLLAMGAVAARRSRRTQAWQGAADGSELVEKSTEIK